MSLRCKLFGCDHVTPARGTRTRDPVCHRCGDKLEASAKWDHPDDGEKYTDSTPYLEIRGTDTEEVRKR